MTTKRLRYRGNRVDHFMGVDRFMETPHGWMKSVEATYDAEADVTTVTYEKEEGDDE